MTEEPARRALRGRQGDVHAQLVVRVRAVAGGAEVKGKFAVAPLPGVGGRRQGADPRRPQHGHLRVLENPGGALKLIDYATSRADHQERPVLKYSKTPTMRPSSTTRRSRRSTVRRRAARRRRDQAKARPVSPVYPQISEAIYKNVNAALSGSMSPEEALKTGGYGHQSTRWRPSERATAGSRLHRGRHASRAALPRYLRSAAWRADDLAVPAADRARRGIPDRLRGLAVAARVQRHRVAGVSRWARRPAWATTSSLQDPRVLGRVPHHVRLHGLVGVPRGRSSGWHGAGDGTRVPVARACCALSCSSRGPCSPW